MQTGQTLPTLFKQRVALTPDAPALVDGVHRYTYAQLDRWASAVRTVLDKAGILPGSYVGISLAGGAPVVAAVLGVLKAGCAYVPLDPSYPADRLAFMTADAQAAAVLTETDAYSSFDFGGHSIEMVGPDAPADAFPDIPVQQSHLAYIIYTSGSTGRPKGTMVNHGNVIALLSAAQVHMDAGPDDRWSFYHSFSFDFSVWEMWGALSSGGCIVCVPPAARLRPRRFTEFLRQEQITILNMVPSAFRHLLAHDAHPGEGFRLRRVIFGGEAFDARSVSSWLEQLPPDRRPEAVNMYGITESTVHVTYRLVTEDDLCRTTSGTVIGNPLAHVNLVLTDSSLAIVPAGEPGEIVLFGPGVSAGYLNHPELNATRFPLIDGPDGRPVRCFRTGDLAAWSARDGALVYKGRIDDQVQLRGYRIEPGEVESVLRGCADVREAVVTLSNDGGPALVAYVQPEHADADVLRRIQTHARAFLPRHMLPARYTLVRELPRTASGKIDRSAFC